MRTIEEVVSELASELSRFLEEPKDQRERVKANLDHLKCGKCLNEIVEIHKAEKNEWIPVGNGESPEEYQRVWITDNNGLVCMGDVIYGYGFYDGCVCGRHVDRGEILAWMPIFIPEPYKEDEE